jgi:hypothetical protein
MRASDAGADAMRNCVTGLAGVQTDSVEHFWLVRTVQGPASNGFLPPTASGRCVARSRYWASAM